MIKRESYMKKIRPFINSDLVKVLTGIRRCGKSVMLDLIKQELLQQGVTPQQLISYNFENMSFARLCNAQALHDEIINKTQLLTDIDTMPNTTSTIKLKAKY